MKRFMGFLRSRLKVFRKGIPFTREELASDLVLLSRERRAANLLCRHYGLRTDEEEDSQLTDGTHLEGKDA